MHIKLVSENDREARLANRRVRIEKDGVCRRPDMSMDLIFHPGHGEVWGFKVEETYSDASEVFTADRAKVEEESKACGHKTEEEKREWLEGIKNAEKKMWQAWMDSDMYGITTQVWDNAGRQWKCVDSRYELFGWDDVVEALKDIDKTGVEVFCVDEDCGDPKDWNASLRELDI